MFVKKNTLLINNIKYLYIYKITFNWVQKTNHKLKKIILIYYFDL